MIWAVVDWGQFHKIVAEQGAPIAETKKYLEGYFINGDMYCAERPFWPAEQDWRGSRLFSDQHSRSVTQALPEMPAMHALPPAGEHLPPTHLQFCFAAEELSAVNSIVITGAVYAANFPIFIRASRRLEPEPACVGEWGDEGWAVCSSSR